MVFRLAPLLLRVSLLEPCRRLEHERASRPPRARSGAKTSALSVAALAIVALATAACEYPSFSFEPIGMGGVPTGGAGGQAGAGGAPRGGAGGQAGAGGGGSATHGGGGAGAAAGGGAGGQAGAGGAQLVCEPGMHACPGFDFCIGNTVASGCWKSDVCDPCPEPEHSTASCTAGGECAFDCGSYLETPDGLGCYCPTDFDVFTCIDCEAQCSNFGLGVKECALQLFCTCDCGQ